MPHLEGDALAAFNEKVKQSFSGQAKAFLDCFWDKVQDQKEFIFNVTIKIFQKVDMESKGISFVHQYTEGEAIDMNIAMKFYEDLNKFLGEAKNAQWVDAKYASSQVEVLTAIQRKQKISESDVNGDGKVTFLEVLLQQYGCSPEDFAAALISQPEEHAGIKAVREKLEACQAKEKKYQAELAELEAKIESDDTPAVQKGVAKQALEALKNGPQAAEIAMEIQTATNDLKKITKAAAEEVAQAGADFEAAKNQGSVWWMEAEAAEAASRRK